MASVPLEFVFPEEPNLVALLIYEAPVAGGPFIQIERVTAIGTFPNYISNYTTNNATSVEYWFAIRFEDSTGALSDLSAPIKGGTRTLVGEIVDRVLLRDGTLNDNIIAQEAEAVIQYVMGGDPYAYDIDDVTYVELSAMTDLTLAASWYTRFIEKTTTTYDYTAGLVSEKSGTSGDPTKNLNAIALLEARANKRLNKKVSIIAMIEDRYCNTYELTATTPDPSRLLATITSAEVVEIE